MRIDAHQHFWSLDRGDYDWLTPELSALYRDFYPSDLDPLLEQNQIEGTVLVQASPTLAETNYLLSLANKHDFIKGVVGWVDFESFDAIQTVNELAKDPKVVGLRPMIQDIEDVDWMLSTDFTPVFNAIINHNLVFDALTKPNHLPNLRRLLLRHPELRTVIDHGSKPVIAAREFEPWAVEMALIAKNSQAFVKLSGLVTEAKENWSVDDLTPYVDHLFTCFGADRIIWGSDWPVCNLASDYTEWCETTDEILNGLSTEERDAVLGGNAMRVYSLKG